MPVEDHAVHPSVVQRSHHYGCHSARRTKPRQPGYLAPTRRYEVDGRYSTHKVYVIDATSPACRQYPLWDTDPRCAGCEQPKDVEYAKTKKELK